MKYIETLPFLKNSEALGFRSGGRATPIIRRTSSLNKGRQNHSWNYLKTFLFEDTYSLLLSLSTSTC